MTEVDSTGDYLYVKTETPARTPDCVHGARTGTAKDAPVPIVMCTVYLLYT